MQISSMHFLCLGFCCRICELQCEQWCGVKVRANHRVRLGCSVHSTETCARPQAVRRMRPRNEDRVLESRMGPHALKTTSLQLPVEAVAR
mgnify:CR=1 FL=1